MIKLVLNGFLSKLNSRLRGHRWKKVAKWSRIPNSYTSLYDPTTGFSTTIIEIYAGEEVAKSTNVYIELRTILKKLNVTEER